MLTRRSAVLAVTFPSLMLFSGCDREWGPPGPSHTETQSIELDKSESVSVELKMGAGELRVRGGSPKLMEGEFTYRRLRMRPQIHYDSGGFHGRLAVEEAPGVHSAESRYRWDLAFNDGKPLDLDIDFGAGEGRLDLGSLSLRRVDIRMGVGELRIDLRGEPKNDYTVSIHGGVGEATIYLPENVGVIADARGGIGDIHARGLQNRDGRYVNAAYGRAKTTVLLEIRGGIGAINLIGD